MSEAGASQGRRDEVAGPAVARIARDTPSAPGASRQDRATGDDAPAQDEQSATASEAGARPGRRDEVAGPAVARIARDTPSAPGASRQDRATGDDAPAQDEQSATAGEQILAQLFGPGGSPLAVPGAALVPGGASPSTPADRAADRRLARVAIPAVALAGIAAVGLIVVLVAILIGWTGVAPIVAAAICAVATAGFSGIAVRAGILGRPAQESNSQWESRQPWIGPLGTGPERRLVGLACRAVERIVGCAAWWSRDLDDHRLTLDLAAELDQIDGQAYALAAAGSTDRPRTADAGASTPDADPAWTALVDHVAALVDYADRLQAHDTGQRPPIASTGSHPRGIAAGAAAGAVRDEFATAHLQQLAADLAARPDE